MGLHVSRLLIHYDWFDFKSLFYSRYLINKFYTEGRRRQKVEIPENVTKIGGVDAITMTMV